MKIRLLIFLVCVGGLLGGGSAQTIVEKRVPVEGQRELEMDLPFARDIQLITWDKQEVYVKVSVSINDGEDDALFQLEVGASSTVIDLVSNRDYDRGERKRRNCWDMEISYEIYFPKSLEIDAESISGSYVMEYYGKPAYFKTISGDVDLTVPASDGLDFQAKTISGEVYSDLDIAFPDGKDGLRQMVGTDIAGEVNGGGTFLNLETISGDIFLRNAE